MQGLLYCYAEVIPRDYFIFMQKKLFPGISLLSCRDYFVVMQGLLCCHAGINLLSCRDYFVAMQGLLCYFTLRGGGDYKWML